VSILKSISCSCGWKEQGGARPYEVRCDRESWAAARVEMAGGPVGIEQVEGGQGEPGQVQKLKLSVKVHRAGGRGHLPRAGAAMSRRRRGGSGPRLRPTDHAEHPREQSERTTSSGGLPSKKKV